LLLLVPAAGLSAQAAGADPCLRPDSLVVRGLKRVTRAEVVTQSGLVLGNELNVPMIQRAARALYGTGMFDDVRLACETISPTSAHIAVTVVERPTLSKIDVVGPALVSSRAVSDKIELFLRRPVDPALVTKAIARIDSLYETNGFYLTRIQPETTWVDSSQIELRFRVEEGRRLAISQLLITGNAQMSATAIVGAMKTKPEGFFWFRKGEYDEDKYVADLGELLPQFYAERGFIDFQILRDTLRVDRELGKGIVELELEEGPSYRVGTFSLNGNRHFTDADLRRYFPFGDAGPSLSERAMNLVRGKEFDPDRFDRSRWENAVIAIQGAYQNDGYIYAQVEPVLERSMGAARDRRTEPSIGQPDRHPRE
jgi:outer membrane protein insertion porin family